MITMLYSGVGEAFLDETVRYHCPVFAVISRPINRYSLDIFLFSGPLGILGSDGKQNTV